jgi:uncharacterized protein
MKPRDTYPPGVPCWVDTTQPDPDAGAAFYAGLFGWEFEDVTPEGAPGRYLVGRLDGQDVAAISAPPADGPRPQTVWNTYVRVKDADGTAEVATRAGGSIVAEPFDIPGAGRMALLADPEGAVVSIWQANGFEGAQAVNQPGAWVFSDLATADVRAAEAFYFELFGWETATGLGGFEFWRLRGYADFLMRDDPELRKRQAEVGADDAFADCVAAIEPLAGGEPARWNVTFGVDDADETAAKARELGGEVLVEPFDAGPVRNVVIRDPQGATFTGSRFYPERLMAQREAEKTTSA